MAVVIDRPGAKTAATPPRRCRRIGAIRASRSSRQRPALILALGVLILVAGLLLSATGVAAPIIGDPNAAAGATTARPPGLSGGGPPRVGIVVSCGVRTDGLTTCAVSRGQAAVCPERVPGAAIQRSYRRYDYRPVEGGCTLDGDYWRTHARNGEAPFDDTWDRLGESGRAAFFNASETYEEILAEGAGVGPYYRLARAYIAAELNGINGAPLPDEAASAFEEATALFLAGDPERPDAGAAVRFEALADVLEDYNAGAKGPGICPPLTVEPFSAADAAETVQGAESHDAGKVVAVDQRYGRGAGVVTLQPLSEADEFLLSDEGFTVEGVRKAKFTTELTDCVDVATGQETTIAVGGRPSAPRLTSASFLGEERLVRMMVAVSEAAAEAAELAPAAGPAAAPAPIAPASIGAATGTGGAGSFPSQVLPAATAGGGGGEAFVTVPDLIGETVAEARNTIAAAGLSIGQITMSERRAMLDGMVGVAWADDSDSATVVDQSPRPGAEAGPGDPVDLTAEFSIAIPEPASLLLFATGLALIAIAMARRRSE